MNYGLLQTQTQRQTLSLKMQQRLHLLQCSNFELLEYIQQEANKNPALEWTYDPMETFKRNVPSRRKGGESGWEAVHAAKDETHETLERHLSLQLHCSTSRCTQNVVEYLIGNLDENGFLSLPLEQAAVELGVPLPVAEEALRVLQSFDPSGVGARSLQECLMLQLRQREEEGSLAYTIVEHHLDTLAEKSWSKIAKSLKVPLSDVQAAHRLILGLNPRLGAAFWREPVHYVVPELRITSSAEGRFAAVVNRSMSSALSVNAYYKGFCGKAAGDDMADYIKRCVDEVHWLKKSMEQRDRTLHTIGDAIAESQAEFFRGGIAFLVPMTLKEMALRVGVHESTVSRAIAGKYAQTPQGIYELSFFFSAGIETEEGVIAVKTVKDKLKQLIRSESNDAPYSDQQLAELLKASGMPVSRRTVAKYREQLGIASSSKRWIR